jgi:hypoxanthine-guanine phosphoribosyltransferase
LNGASCFVADLLWRIAGEAGYGFLDVVRDDVSHTQIDSTTEIDFLSWIQLVALIDRPDARTVDLTVDFGAFEGSDGAYVGYGLEIEGRHGNHPNLALVS